MFPEFAAHTEFPRSAHPGTVGFVGTDGVERVEPADHLPEWLKFAPDADGTPVPVVRVVRVATDRGYALRSYGADGRLLWVGMTTTAAPPAQPERLSGVATRRDTGRPAAPHRPAYAAEPTGWF